jgi:beta-glucanase (GH16 family)
MLTVTDTRCVVLSVILIGGAAGCWDGSHRTPGAREPNVVFFDDFSGPEIDRAKWNVIVTGRTVNHEQQAYVDSNETLAVVTGEDANGAKNGALLIRGVWKPGFVSPQGDTYDFISGRMETRGKFEFAYGTWAARMKLTAGAGLWPAFWTLGTGRWPDTGEIDIMESVGEPRWISVALHGPGYSGNTPLMSRFSFGKGTDATSWHIYSMDWSVDRVVFRVDGEVIYTATRDVVTRYGPWAYDNPKFMILNLALGGDYPAAVNGAGSPYRGLPEATMQLIRDGRAKVLVDWVRVTKR